MYGGTDIIITACGGCPYCGCTCSQTCTVGFGTNFILSWPPEPEIAKIIDRPAWLKEQRRVPRQGAVIARSEAYRRVEQRRTIPPGFARRPTAAHRMGLRDARP